MFRKKVSLSACAVLASAAALLNINFLKADGDQGFKQNGSMEKCYGIAKSYKNDCKSADGAHSCAAKATKDGDPKEWMLVPKGLCDKIVGGSTTPPDTSSNNTSNNSYTFGSGSSYQNSSSNGNGNNN